MTTTLSPGSHPGGIEDRSRSGQYAAAEQSPLRERHLRGNRDQLILVDHGLLRESAEGEDLRHRGCRHETDAAGSVLARWVASGYGH